MIDFRGANDYETRQGLTFAPVTTQPVHKSGRPLHSEINGADWLFELYLRVMAKCHKWGSGPLSDNQKRNLAKWEQIMKDELKKDTGMRFRTPSSSGGTTGTGNQAKRFFSKEVIPTLERILERSRAANAGSLIAIHKNFCIIFRTISSSSMVDCDRLQELCTETYVAILQIFPWALVTGVHEVLGHCFQVMRVNDCYGMGLFSEQGLEGKQGHMVLCFPYQINQNEF